MRLSVGDAAPDFRITDTTGTVHSLQDYAGRRLLLSFHRYAACPMCNLHIHELTSAWPQLKERGLDVLAVFMSGSGRLADQFAARDVPFPLAADPERRMYDAYGVESSLVGMLKSFVHPRAMKAFFSGFFPGRIDGDTRTLPADFVIDADLSIRTAFYSTNITQHLPLNDVLEAGSAARPV